MPPFGRVPARDEGFQEGLQTRHDIAEQAGRDDSIAAEFVQAHSKTAFHQCSPFGGLRPLKGFYTAMSCDHSRQGTQQN